jgi:hypothetical protein
MPVNACRNPYGSRCRVSGASLSNATGCSNLPGSSHYWNLKLDRPWFLFVFCQVPTPYSGVTTSSIDTPSPTSPTPEPTPYPTAVSHDSFK